MTRYEQGFLTKCAEYGLDVKTSAILMKKAFDVRPITEARKFKTLGKISTLLSKKPKLYDRIVEKMGGGLGGEFYGFLHDQRNARDAALSAAEEAIKKNPKKFGRLSKVLAKSKEQMRLYGDDFINNDVARSQIADTLETMRTKAKDVIMGNNSIENFIDDMWEKRRTYGK